MDTHFSSFSTARSYLRALSQTPSRLSRRAFSVSTSYQETNRVRARSGPNMKRSLRWYDVVCFGVGGMVGAGVFVTTGRASHLYAGPSASWEFLAFLTDANLIIDYLLSNAAVARSFTAFLSTAFGLITHSQLRFTINDLPKGYNEMDVIAMAVVLRLTLVICYSTRGSSLLNMVLTALHILFIVFVIVVGFLRGEWKNFTEPSDPKNAAGFFPFGVTWMFNGAAMVYLSYIGYDAVSTMAEEVKKSSEG